MYLTIGEMVDLATKNAAEAGFRSGAEWQAKRAELAVAVRDLHDRQREASLFAERYREEVEMKKR
jgi:hypothetical protein